MPDRPIVILTALELEYAAVRNRLTKVKDRRHPEGTRFEVGRLPRDGTQIVLCLTGAGNHPAAVLAERAITTFNPTAVLFIGVAGALKPHLGLGDIVLATQIYAYHGGRSTDAGFQSRPRVWPTDHSAEQTARAVVRTDAWAEGLDDTPSVHFAPIAAGEVVLDSTSSPEAKRLREHYDDAFAVEMEAAGVAQAAHWNRSRPVLVIRAISDLADGSKHASDAQDWQRRAVAGAAALGVALAAELAADARDSKATKGQTDDTSSKPSGNVNIAAGHSRVGAQIGQVDGNLTLGRPE